MEGELSMWPLFQSPEGYRVAQIEPTGDAPGGCAVAVRERRNIERGVRGHAKVATSTYRLSKELFIRSPECRRPTLSVK